MYVRTAACLPRKQASKYEPRDRVEIENRGMRELLIRGSPDKETSDSGLGARDLKIARMFRKEKNDIGYIGH